MLEENFYYNINKINETTSPQAINYIQNFGEETKVVKQDDWKMCVLRFKLPVPPFIFKYDQTMYITFRFNGTDYQQQVLFEQWDFSTTDEVVICYEQFLNMVNTAILAAFQACDASETITPTIAPKMYFDADLNKFYLYVQSAWVSGGSVPDLYFSSGLWNKIPTFSAMYYGDDNGSNGILNYKIIMTNQRTNVNASGTYFNFYQQSNSLGALYDIQRIQIETAGISIVSEGINNNNALQSTSSNFNQILTDFAINYNSNEPLVYDGSYFIYNIPNTNVRWVHLTSTTPLKNLNFRVYYILKDGTKHQWFNPPGENVNIKFLFQKKKYLK